MKELKIQEPVLVDAFWKMRNDLKRIRDRKERRHQVNWRRWALRQHILDMGLIPGVKITMVKFAPMGDPCGSGLFDGAMMGMG